MANTNATKPQEGMGSNPQSMSDKPRSFGQSASDMASATEQKASEAASTIGKKASDAASAVGEKADDATASVGHGMKSLAGTIRDKSPESGMIHGVSGAVADTLERGGDYLEERQLSGMARDVTDIVRKYPFAAILVGLGVGFFFARLTSRS